MNLQTTSYYAYQSIINKINSRQYLIIGVLKEMGEANNNMISSKLNLPINCVTPRVRELVIKGVVEHSRINYCPITKQKTIFWKLREVKDIGQSGEKTTLKQDNYKEVV